MNNRNLKKNNKVFILCPAHVQTGGTELLHQLAEEIGKYRECYIVYTDRYSDNPTPGGFLKYNIKSVRLIPEEDRNNNNVIIIPETMTDKIKQYQKMTVLIWWLSVDNFGAKNLSFTEYLIREMGQVYFSFWRDKKKYLHLVQSKYAYDYLKNKGINKERIRYLTDYINTDFLDKKAENTTTRRNGVLYNPKKGLEFTKKIINYAKDIEFIPIENMTRENVHELMLNTKVYIDFGNHPGKDRLPREAALSGMCVITGTLGAAGNDVDVCIPNKYKFKTDERNIPFITECIREIMENYDEKKNDFSSYVNLIRNERNTFENEVRSIFT